MGGVNHVLAKHIDRWLDYTECETFLSTHLSEIKYNLKRANLAGQLVDLLFELQMGCLLSLNWPDRVRYNRCSEPGLDYGVFPERIDPFNVYAIGRLTSMEGSYYFLPIPGFERNLELMLMKQSDMSRSSGMAGNSVIPFYKTDVPLRVCDVICEKLGREQFKPGMPNVLAIYSTSLTLHRWHVPLALDIMREKAEQGDDKFFRDRRHSSVADVKDYFAKIGNLSGVWFRTNYHLEKTGDGDNGWIECDEMTPVLPKSDSVAPTGS